MAASPIVLEGWLLKKKREGGGLLTGRAYQKRWFELRHDSLSYVKEAKGGRGQEAGGSFNLRELKSICRVDGDKLEMDFPSRQLRVKTEVRGGLTRWHQAIDNLLRRLSGATPLGSPMASPTHVANFDKGLGREEGEGTDEEEEENDDHEQRDSRSLRPHAAAAPSVGKPPASSQVKVLARDASSDDEEDEEPLRPTAARRTPLIIAASASGRERVSPPPKLIVPSVRTADGEVESDDDGGSTDGDADSHERRSNVSHQGGMGGTGSAAGSGTAGRYPVGQMAARGGGTATASGSYVPPPVPPRNGSAGATGSMAQQASSAQGSYFQRDAPFGASASTGKRPPSPRSLLANPRLAQAMIKENDVEAFDSDSSPRGDSVIRGMLGAIEAEFDAQPPRQRSGGSSSNVRPQPPPPALKLTAPPPRVMNRDTCEQETLVLASSGKPSTASASNRKTASPAHKKKQTPAAEATASAAEAPEAVETFVGENWDSSDDDEGRPASSAPAVPPATRGAPGRASTSRPVAAAAPQRQHHDQPRRAQAASSEDDDEDDEPAPVSRPRDADPPQHAEAASAQPAQVPSAVRPPNGRTQETGASVGSATATSSQQRSSFDSEDEDNVRPTGRAPQQAGVSAGPTRATASKSQSSLDGHNNHTGAQPNGKAQQAKASGSTAGVKTSPVASQ